jgi:16S rRNA processing protein RimM
MADTYDPRTIAIGVLGKPHGVQGEISLRLFNLESPLLTELSSVILERAGQRAARVVTRSRPFGKGLLVMFAGISTREQASALTLSHVRIDRSALPTPRAGEYFVSDVVGCEVFSQDGARLGIADETFWNGAHDIMVVRNATDPAGEKEHLIPLVPDFILQVDAAGRIIRVTWQLDDQPGDQAARAQGDDQEVDPGGDQGGNNDG